eukprot:4302338-Pyramimonas_sp.AAC.1
MEGSAAGLDEVTIKMLRLAAPALQQRFFDLVRRHWQAPDSWGEGAHAAEVIALFKKGDRSKLTNYR